MIKEPKEYMNAKVFQYAKEKGMLINCLYVRKESGLTVYILLFVSDLLICCENEEVIAEIKNKLSEG